MRTKITENFTLEEFFESATAKARNINNFPPVSSIRNIHKLAQCLEQVRALLGKPIKITSGFRCLELNLAIGGARRSSHMTGCAADFVCPEFGTPKQIMDAILASGIRFHRIIYEKTWIHIDIPNDAANEGYDMLTLEAVFNPGEMVKYIPYNPRTTALA